MTTATTTRERSEAKLERKGIGGRPYSPQPCVVCKCEAQVACNVLSRSVGRGQGMNTRKIKLGSTVRLCGRCSRNVSLFIDHLGEAANDSLRFVRRTQRHSGPSLFDQAEA